MEGLKYELDQKYKDCNYFRLKSGGEQSSLDMEIYRGEFDRVIGFLHNINGFKEEEISDLVSMIKEPFQQVVFANGENYVILTPSVKSIINDKVSSNLNSIFEQGPESFQELYSAAIEHVKDGQTYFFLQCYNGEKRVEIYYNDRHIPFHYMGFSGICLDKFEKSLTSSKLQDSEIIHASDGILRE